MTEGAIGSAELWILGVKRQVSTIIHKCVTCRRLRGSTEKPKMPTIRTGRIRYIRVMDYLCLSIQGRPLRKLALGRHVYLFGYNSSPNAGSRVSTCTEIHCHQGSSKALSFRLRNKLCWRMYRIWHNIRKHRTPVLLQGPML